MITWKWATSWVLTCWIWVTTFSISRGWVQGYGLLIVPVLAFGLELHVWLSPICVLIVVPSLAYSTPGWWEWWQMSLTLYVLHCWLTTHFTGSMAHVVCHSLQVDACLSFEDFMMTAPIASSDALSYPHNCGDTIVFSIRFFFFLLFSVTLFFIFLYSLVLFSSRQHISGYHFYIQSGILFIWDLNEIC